jgi:hypothetical protein
VTRSTCSTGNASVRKPDSRFDAGGCDSTPAEGGERKVSLCAICGEDGCGEMRLLDGRTYFICDRCETAPVTAYSFSAERSHPRSLSFASGVRRRSGRSTR